MVFSTAWAFQIFFAKLGFLSGAQAFSFQAFVTVIVSVILAIALLPRFGPSFFALYRRQPALFWQLFAANAIQGGLGTSLSLIGISLTAAINAGFLVKMATITTTLFAWIILKERLTPLKIAVIVVMLSGAYLLTTKGQALLPQVGDLFILAACVCWSFGNVLVRKILRTQPVPADVVTLQKPLAALPVLLSLIFISFVFPAMIRYFPVLACCTFPSGIYPFALGSGICLALAWIYLNRTLKVATASYMTLMSMITPVIVAILAMFFLGENLVPIQIVGASMIVFSGVVIYFSNIAIT